ncbi:hypothetical protein CTAYLR_010239 [Chrysophaeum taylorii]|uniref:STI1 domain-containing protein n=1 Tax=Chrysophaeum taylorii TaxID=2483200 RepID=A0AAD7UJB4_9STRA|nr:hypothetical protein CTAYLR_010239 [Chrysophaeum taylorii]
MHVVSTVAVALALSEALVPPPPPRVTRRCPPLELAAVDEETLSSIRKMRTKEIQAELKSRGVKYDDCFEKEDLVKRLASSRASGPPPSEATEAAEQQPRRPSPESSSPSASTSSSSSATSTTPPSYDEARAKASGMRLSQLQAALKDMGVSTRGMIDKRELVEAYARAFVEGVGKDNDDDDGGPVRELKTTKMKKEGEDAGGGRPGRGASGFPDVGGMGDFGGIDLGSILSGMGGMGGGMGGSGGPRGSRPGGASIQDLMQKAMGNPKLMAAIQKAAQNPRTMAAIQDVMANGPGAVNKYANDPEIRKMLDELKSIL